MNNPMKNTLIGAFVSVAIGLIIGMILFIEPTVGDGKQVIRVYFTNISGITDGTRVTLAGRVIGTVYQMNQIPDARRKSPTHRGDSIYFYEVTLHVDSKATIYTTDRISAKTIGLLGDTIIAIIPTYLPSNIRPLIVTPNTPMYAESNDFLDETLEDVSKLAKEMDRTFQKVTRWIEKNDEPLSEGIQEFTKSSKEISIFVKKMNEMDLAAKLGKTLDAIEKSTLLIQEELSLFKQGGGFTSFLSLVHHLDSIGISLDQIMEATLKGEGTIGRLLVDKATSERVESVLTSTDEILKDIHRYGLLYFYNREWKRNRLNWHQKECASPLSKSESEGCEKNFHDLYRSLGKLEELTKHGSSSSALQKEIQLLQRKVQQLQKGLSCSENKGKKE